METMTGPMMRVLLEEYFHLKIHQQKAEGPVYFLRVARGGPKLHPFAEGSCTPMTRLHQNRSSRDRNIAGVMSAAYRPRWKPKARHLTNSLNCSFWSCAVQ